MQFSTSFVKIIDVYHNWFNVKKVFLNFNASSRGNDRLVLQMPRPIEIQDLEFCDKFPLAIFNGYPSIITNVDRWINNGCRLWDWWNRDKTDCLSKKVTFTTIRRSPNFFFEFLGYRFFCFITLATFNWSRPWINVFTVNQWKHAEQRGCDHWRPIHIILNSNASWSTRNTLIWSKVLAFSANCNKDQCMDNWLYI